MIGGSLKNSTETFRRLEFGDRLFAPLRKRFGVLCFGLDLFKLTLGFACLTTLSTVIGSDNVNRLLAELISTIFLLSVSPSKGSSLAAEIEDFEKEIIVGALVEADSSVSSSSFPDFDAVLEVSFSSALDALSF